MSRYKTIYERNAADYDLLVAREDHQGNILRAIESVRSLDGLEVAEFGAGTGRLTTLLAPKVKRIRAFDAFPAMIEVGRRKLQDLRLANVWLDQAENKNLPVETASVDLAVAGWTFGHCTSWFAATWQEEIGAAVAEMLRVLKPGGTALILETLGTGRADPVPPNPALAGYYALLEGVFGFRRRWIRTDYCFPSLEEAQRLTQGFFGHSYEFLQDSDGRAHLPECTGVWDRTLQ